MQRSTRDLGMSGKGDKDRTTDMKKFEKNLEQIERHPEDKTGFEKVGLKRWRKKYGAAQAPAPESLRAAHDAVFRGLSNSSSCSSDH